MRGEPCAGASDYSPAGYAGQAQVGVEKVAAVATMWATRQLCALYFRVQKDKKQTSLTV